MPYSEQHNERSYDVILFDVIIVIIAVWLYYKFKLNE